MKRKYISKKQKRLLYNLQHGKCIYCKLSIPFEQSEVEHFIPIKYVGNRLKGNLFISCKSCNNKKNARLFDSISDVQVYLTDNGSKSIHDLKLFELRIRNRAKTQARHRELLMSISKYNKVKLNIQF